MNNISGIKIGHTYKITGVVIGANANNNTLTIKIESPDEWTLQDPTNDINNNAYDVANQVNKILSDIYKSGK